MIRGSQVPTLQRRAMAATARDLLALTKPHIMVVSVLVCAGGVALAPAHLAPAATLALLLAVGALVGGASALNMYLERDLDRLMPRTVQRPLPARRLRARTVLLFGLSLAGAALMALGTVTSWLTAGLGLLGLLGYVALYTPLKRRSPLALPVGAAAGALPPLMGWTAATGEIGLPGLALYLTLFMWQVPHFLAIALYRQDEYALAGFRTLVRERGEAGAWLRIVIYSALLIPVSLAPVALGLAGWAFGGMAALLGLGLLVVGAAGMLLASKRQGWAVRYFRASLVYLPLVALGMVLDRALF